jgi:hypothetical protein
MNEENREKEIIQKLQSNEITPDEYIVEMGKNTENLDNLKKELSTLLVSNYEMALCTKSSI